MRHLFRILHVGYADSVNKTILRHCGPTLTKFSHFILIISQLCLPSGLCDHANVCYLAVSLRVPGLVPWGQDRCHRQHCIDGMYYYRWRCPKTGRHWRRCWNWRKVSTRRRRQSDFMHWVQCETIQLGTPPISFLTVCNREVCWERASWEKTGGIISRSVELQVQRYVGAESTRCIAIPLSPRFNLNTLGKGPYFLTDNELISTIASFEISIDLPPNEPGKRIWRLYVAANIFPPVPKEEADPIIPGSSQCRALVVAHPK